MQGTLWCSPLILTTIFRKQEPFQVNFAQTKAIRHFQILLNSFEEKEEGDSEMEVKGEGERNGKGTR